MRLPRLLLIPAFIIFFSACGSADDIDAEPWTFVEPDDTTAAEHELSACLRVGGLDRIIIRHEREDPRRCIQLGLVSYYPGDDTFPELHVPEYWAVESVTSRSTCTGDFDSVTFASSVKGEILFSPDSEFLYEIVIDLDVEIRFPGDPTDAAPLHWNREGLELTENCH